MTESTIHRKGSTQFIKIIGKASAKKIARLSPLHAKKVTKYSQNSSKKEIA